MCQSVEKVVCTPGNYGGERRFEKLSDQSEVLLHCSVAILSSESFTGTHSTVIVLCSIPPFLLLHSFPSLQYTICK